MKMNQMKRNFLLKDVRILIEPRSLKVGLKDFVDQLVAEEFINDGVADAIKEWVDAHKEDNLVYLPKAAMKIVNDWGKIDHLG